MAKTLTEQWREGTLPEGLYYIEGKGNHDIALIRNRYCPVLTSPYCEDDVFESEFVPVAPVPSYDHFSQLVKKVERLQEQLKEANEALKYFAETTIGHKQKDGTYGMWLCSGEVAWNNPLERIKTRMDYICYDPRPAKRYLKKWGVK